MLGLGRGIVEDECFVCEFQRCPGSIEVEQYAMMYVCDAVCMQLNDIVG